MMRFKKTIVVGTLVVIIGVSCFSKLSAESSKKTIQTNLSTKTSNPIMEPKGEGFVILHLGDSHIQAGHLSGLIRQKLQSQYGSLGRGWVSPYRVYGSNQPCDYNLQVSNPRNWTSYMLTKKESTEIVGPGGIIVKPRMKNYTMSITAKGNESFDQVLVYRTGAAPHLIPQGLSKNDYVLKPSLSDDVMVADTVRFDNLRTSVTFAPDSAVTPSSAVGFGGFVLENTHRKKGIMYHEIGLNGAFMSQYLNEQFVHSMAMLHPQMVIVSLGSNESSGRAINRDSYYNTIDTFYKMIKHEMPDAQIIFTTPPPYFKSKSGRVGTRKVRGRKTKSGRRRTRRVPVYKRSSSVNSNVVDAADVIAQYCKEHNLVCVNLFDLMGGEEGGSEWLSDGLYARDKIHFSVEGYKKQGNLILGELEKPVARAYKDFTDPNANLQANRITVSKNTSDKM
ncbi:MAG: GDSL-type esterase/lipase family protein [Porphyromonadaceae bacterium]|nr:GDSL-type esterase/lipase family protein [Porphyromonadaceae bacterium]